MTTSIIRSAREGDREALISIATRTTRASYTPFVVYRMLAGAAILAWAYGG